MNLILTLFVFNFYFNQLNVEVRAEAVMGTSINPKNLTKNQTQFMDLNTDCKLLIFKKLELPDLIALSETNTHLLSLAEYIWRCRFAKKSVFFPGLFSSFTSNSNVSPNRNYIMIDHFPTSTKLLKNFGHLISSLKISNYYMPKDCAKNIYKLVNFYCSKTLTEFSISNVLANIFDEFEKPFEKVENVILEGSFDILGNSIHGLNDLFPAMRCLTIGAVNIHNMSWIDIQFNHLERVQAHVFAHISDTPGLVNEAEFEKLLKNNPQIRSLNLKYVSPKLLKIVADRLPYLESLELENYNELDISAEESYNFHFEHMKNFSIKMSLHSMPNNISFGNLEVFHTSRFPKPCRRWIEFIENNKSLKKFSTATIKSADILRLSRADLKLNEIYFECCSEDVEVRNIIDLIENSTELKRIDFKVESSQILNEIVNSLKNTFNNVWTITDFQSKVSMERINYNLID